MLCTMDWPTLLYSCTDVNIAFNIFTSKIQELFNLCFPLVKISKKTFKDKKWMTPGLKCIINKKNNMYKNWINSGSAIDKAIIFL